MKLCKECRHHVDSKYSQDRCMRVKHVESSYISSVNGKEYHIASDSSLDCGNERYDGFIWDIINGTCGKRGRYWVEKDESI